jgi:hypothetical protein
MLCNKKTKQTPILIAYNGKMFDFKVNIFINLGN